MQKVYSTSYNELDAWLTAIPLLETTPGEMGLQHSELHNDVATLTTKFAHLFPSLSSHLLVGAKVSGHAITRVWTEPVKAVTVDSVEIGVFCTIKVLTQFYGSDGKASFS
eukprot:TRINITY_DN68129_c4_g1_i1.p1 TRINITY_DN68129_c4_g1~~TRINITY_DN68129_c4_g1_i1.p1  ORF type:complete len:110 (-),score=11.60 TRINITY_DN68129_c4_g1_i1:24-353(-)